MSINIMDAIKSHLTPSLISKASSFLGESDNAIVKAISGILPVVVGGLISRSASGEAGATEVFNMAKEARNSGISESPGDFFSDRGALLSIGSGLVKSIFGTKAEGIIDNVSAFAGVKKSSAGSLLSLIAPVALSTLGDHLRSANLNAQGLVNLLSNQKAAIQNALPGGLADLAGLTGSGKGPNASTEKARRHLSATERSADNTMQKKGTTMRWLWPFLLLAGAAILGWYLWKGCNRTGNTTAADGGDTTLASDQLSSDTADITINAAWPSLSIDSVSGIINYDLGNDMEFLLPDGSKFTAPVRGFESQLLNFIKEGTIDTANKTANWFNMFDVQFKSGGNEYTGRAEAQLKNCAAILKAYPGVKIKLGGYTDNTGSADGNTKISQQRADKVKADLIKMGATAEQITEAVGYGPLFPVCEANDTPECKARNRRVACKIAVK